MTAYLLILISALLLALAATPVAKRVAYHFGIIDKPNARKVHSVPTPLLGGAAIVTAVLLALVILGDRFYASQVAGILLGATLMSFMGLWDDRSGLSPWIKLAGQCGAAAILTVTDVRIGLFPWEPLNYAATILWVVGITNAMNLLDNMDGLSGGIAAIAALFFLLFAAMSRQYLVGALAAALVGACLGFLFYNLNPASIFMGDTGAGRAHLRHEPGHPVAAATGPEPADDAGQGPSQPPARAADGQPPRGCADMLSLCLHRGRSCDLRDPGQRAGGLCGRRSNVRRRRVWHLADGDPVPRLAGRRRTPGHRGPAREHNVIMATRYTYMRR